MEDKLIKAMACEERVRIYICSSTHLVEEARRRHDLWPTSAAALGRTLGIGSIMGSMLKSEQEQLTIKINGGGAIGTILVDAYHDGHVRGFVSDPHQYLVYNDSDKLAVGLVVGSQGTLEVIKDLGMKENWSGTVELQSGEIGDDFAYYFTVSEQTPSVVSVGVLVNTDTTILSAGALLIQLMPDAIEEDIVKTEELVARLQPISSLIRDHERLEEIVMSLYDDVKILESTPIEFRCNCSKATTKRVLCTLTKEERQQMIEEDHGCEVTCHFCNERYQISEQELIDLEGFINEYGK